MPFGLCPSAGAQIEWVLVSVCGGPLRGMPGTSKTLCLTHLQSLLVFTIRRYWDFFSQPWNHGLDPGCPAPWTLLPSFLGDLLFYFFSFSSLSLSQQYWHWVLSQLSFYFFQLTPISQHPWDVFDFRPARSRPSSSTSPPPHIHSNSAGPHNPAGSRME